MGKSVNVIQQRQTVLVQLTNQCQMPAYTNHGFTFNSQAAKTTFASVHTNRSGVITVQERQNVPAQSTVDERQLPMYRECFRK